VAPPISVELFYKAFESSFGPFSSLDEDIRRKYENTVEFMNNRLLKVNMPNEQGQIVQA